MFRFILANQEMIPNGQHKFQSEILLFSAFPSLVSFNTPPLYPLPSFLHNLPLHPLWYPETYSLKIILTLSLGTPEKTKSFCYENHKSLQK